MVVRFFSAMIGLPLKNKTHFRSQTKHNFIKQKKMKDLFYRKFETK
jgi:hypothetical protein